MASIQIRRATIGDVDDVAKVHAHALQIFARFSKALYGQDPGDVLPALTHHSFSNLQNIFLVAVDSETGQVMGFMRYKIVDPQHPPDRGVPPSDAPSLKHKNHLKDIWKRFNDPREAEQDALYEECHQGRPHIYVAHLMVEPKHQRKGIGRKLLQKAIDVSQEEAIPAFIVSSRESYPLYRSFDFQERKMWTIDNEFWAREIEEREKALGLHGCEGLTEACAGLTEEEAFMVRWPETGSEA